MTTFKMPEPVAWLAEYGGDVYTAQAMRDVLEQAAQFCKENNTLIETVTGTTRWGTPLDCFHAIHAMIKEIK